VTAPIGAWVGFHAVVLALLAVDLGVFHRKAHEAAAREAALWSAVWVGLALAFGALVWRLGGERMALEYYTGWLIEKSLSVDNLFVFLLIFSYFRVPAALQHRVLFWGILGALLLRGLMIAAGTYLIHHFHWVIYVFGGLLLVTAVRMVSDGDPAGPKGQSIVALVRRVLPISEHYAGARFFIRGARAGGGTRLMATPLLLVLITIEVSDLVFAVDSIPAIFAVTSDPFIVYTSNVFAILGLRALYFLLAGMIPRFRLLRPALSLVLFFVGAKMLTSGFLDVPLPLSLGFIGTVLLGAIVLSLLRPAPAGSAAARVGPDGGSPGTAPPAPS
jgi:tellurite resistance protein TerC